MFYIRGYISCTYYLTPNYAYEFVSYYYQMLRVHSTFHDLAAVMFWLTRPINI